MIQRKHTPSLGLLLPALLLAALLQAPAAQAQKLKERMADRHSEVFDYPKVASIYENLSAKGKADANDLRLLAVTYRKMGEPKLAESAYNRLMALGPARPGDMLAYADLLRANGKYPEALEWYGNYAVVVPDDARVNAYLADPGLFGRLLADSSSASIRTVPINSPQADLGMSVLEELLLFSSARGEGVGGRRAYNWDEEPFLNLYSALLKGETAEDPMVMHKDINSRYHDGTVTYDSLAKRLYFTRNNLHYGVLSMSAKGNLNLGIYFADVVTGEFGQPEWGVLIPFEHNDPDHNYGQPCISPDGRKLYFVSDRPGGMGGTDIWFCDNLGNQWGAPQNMGPKVNTSADEMYPFHAVNNFFYFASNGHPGLGGMDLFRTRATDGVAGNVFNLGYPMNTQYNDHSLILLNDSTGFFASDRPGGMGSDDIYGCTIRPPMIFLSGIVVDKNTREPIEGATVLLKDPTGQQIKRYQLQTEPGGKFKIEVEYRERYLLVANMSGYFQAEMPINTDGDPLDGIVVELVKYDYAAEGTIFNGETEQPLADAVVVLTDGKDVELGRYTTDASGRYQFALMPESDYRLKVERDGFFKQSARISTKGKPSAVIYTDFRLFPLKVDQVVRLENILYDYNKADIRPDAALELDKLIATLQDNPTVSIELSSHTDCRGKDAYNQSLSERRAKSAVDYIISKGIDKSRVKSKGYGKSKPSESCKCEECTEEQNQRNRRTEFKVLGL
ncbi:MAG: carboxypeptidase regulatory-like domain-containing protein [Flavobacteriales bacterium]|nr:carboxypeptidase regulatory-like domain-containing protein [Flavobacteriales bacterium]